MDERDIQRGLQVIVPVHGGGYRRGVIIAGPMLFPETRCLPGDPSVWTVRFPSGASSQLAASEFEPADAVTRLGGLLGPPPPFSVPCI